MGAPGPLNLITDVAGLRVGHVADTHIRTGVTVILPDRRAACSVDVRGGGSGTRETDLLRPEAAMPAVDALCLSGGSAFGLDAASGVMQWLAERRRGFSIHGHVVPIVPGAILFDLANGGDKDWGAEPPYRRLGHAACEAATDVAFPLGNTGAGYGAKAGRLKGGLGSASWREADGLVVAALVAANPVGSVLTPGNRGFWAQPWEQGDEFGGLKTAFPDGVDLGIAAEARITAPSALPPSAQVGGHTCIGVVATNAVLDKAGLRQVAAMAHDGLARAVRPVHTPMDGDTIFALATAAWQDQGDAAGRNWLIARIGSIAADCMARAVARGVWAAVPLGDEDCAATLLRRQEEGKQ